MRNASAYWNHFQQPVLKIKFLQRVYFSIAFLVRHHSRKQLIIAEHEVFQKERKKTSHTQENLDS